MTRLAIGLILFGFIAWLIPHDAPEAARISGSGSTAVSGWPSVDTTKEITWANSLANAARFGDGVTPICLYTDATLGPQVRPCTDANVTTIIPATFTWALWDVSGAAAMETVKPSAATTNLMWQYGAAYEPKKSIWFDAGSLSTDGTQCVAPAEVTLNSGPKTWTVICADNNASAIYGKVRMPDSWDGGTIIFKQMVVQTAADTNELSGTIAAECRGVGVAVDGTFGSTQTLIQANLSGSNKVDEITSAAVTPNGTCTGGSKMLFWKYLVDATGTTTAMATANILGFNLAYSTSSRSD